MWRQSGRACGALVALAILAGCGGAQRSPDVARVEVDGIVASRVNGSAIYLADVELEATAQGLINPGERIGIGHPAYREVLDQLIDQRLMAQEAEARGLHLDANARRRLESARERVLGNLLVESLVASGVTEERVRQMYSEQVALQQIDDEVRIRHILLESEADALAARTRIMAGEDFSSVAFDISLDTATRIEGGELGYVEPTIIGEPFSSMIADTDVGAVSVPFESEAGWHLIKVEDRRSPPPSTLDQMRPQILTFLTYAEISEILTALRREAVLEAGADVPRISSPVIDEDEE